MSEANNGGRGDRACGREVWGNPRNPLIRDSDTEGWNDRARTHG